MKLITNLVESIENYTLYTFYRDFLDRTKDFLEAEIMLPLTEIEGKKSSLRGES